ncbi:alpha/beta fold hydrolase [Rhodococcus sp. X156]|uniref:alpha/beta fold hydrolase n=1 Tax=Rhodococcus sp. X156 TaxID=2499145 RepID=UPI001F49C9F7|nr:alpha/beta fold hydrolase [Rhodococcus sp. X156]
MDLTRSVLARRPLVTVVLDIAGRGRWTLYIKHGEVSLVVGAIARPTCCIRTDAATLADLLMGRRSGVEAFLTGDLVARGSLNTVLQVGGAFAPEAHLPTRAHSREVSAYGVRTAYLEAGPADGRPVVLLHGLGATNASMLPVLADLAKDHRVISPDTPGFGASEAPPWKYTAEQMHRWLRSFLDAVDARGAVVIGNSLGGRLALELALRDPDAVDRLVLLCPAPAFRRFRQLAPVAKRLPMLMARMPFGPPRPALVTGLKAMFADPSRLPSTWYDAAIDEFLIAMKDPSHRRAALSAMLNIYTDEPFGESGFWDRLPHLEPPALFIWGAADRLVPASFARHVTEALPDAESVVIPDCGHVPQFELPELTMRLTRSFLATGRRHVPADRVLRQWKDGQDKPGRWEKES